MQALSAPPKRERLTPLPDGTQLQSGRFVALEQLGVGGQGTAYLSRETETGNIVVLKEFILPVYVDVNVRRQALERMQNEAAMLRRLDNERVVRLIDFFIEDHRGYLVLECIDGFSLRKLVDEQGCMKESQVRELAAQMCEMLKYLHNLTPPVVHRDFTPDNLILGSDGVLKIVDFNVAQQTESTATGTVVGKQAYLPPEQFRGRPVAQSDIYAMGATLYFLLLGNDPEPITCSHPILKDENISQALDSLVAKATALDLAKRYQRIEDLEADLI
jgi:serine/threonine-protein kinase